MPLSWKKRVRGGLVVENKKFFLEADIKLEKPTKERKEAASAVIKLPEESKKQPDLQYFSAVFVSSGENLNHAFFLPSELVAAEGTIVNKALDVEHKEEEIIGHIYDRAFTNKDGEAVNLTELSAMEKASLDKEEIHVQIAGIIYKNRFPNIAQEVSDNKWKVSMECYFRDFDIKIGDLIVSRKEAESLGLAAEDSSILGRVAKVIRNGHEIAKGELARVLKGICFSGCGIVKNPANPPSVILETANKKEEEKEIVLYWDEEADSEKASEEDNNNVTSDKIEDNDSEVSENKEESDMEYDDTVGICVSYKKRVYNSTDEGPNKEVMHENWCTLYDQGCTSFSRDTTDPDCLRYQVRSGATASFNKLLEKRNEVDRREALLERLTAALDEADKLKR